MTQVNAAAVEQVASTNARPVPPGRTLIGVKIVAQKYEADTRSIFRWADAGIIPIGLKLGSLRKWDAAVIDEHIANGCPRVRPLKGGRA